MAIMNQFKKLFTATCLCSWLLAGSCGVSAMNLYIKQMDGTTFEVDVEPTDTIGTVKTRLEGARATWPPARLGQASPPLDRVRLLFQQKPLEDTKTLASYGIRTKDCTVHCAMTIAYQVFLKMQHKTVTLDGLKPSMTIAELKQKVEDQEGVKIQEQRLIFSGKELSSNKDSETLQQCNLARNATVHLVTRLVGGNNDIVVLIKLITNETIPVTVDPAVDTIGTLKAKLAATHTGPEVERQVLRCIQTRGQAKLDDDTKSLASYGITRPNMTVHCSLVLARQANEPFPVFVKMVHKTVTFNVRAGMMIEELRREIQDREGIDYDAQRLVYGGKQLQDATSLKDNKIGKDATLHLVVKMKGGQSSGHVPLLSLLSRARQMA